MKVIVTGGSGLIGRHLTQALARDGHEVVVLSRDPEKHRGDLPAGVRAVQWDAESAQGWAAEADGADAIVNLAGENLSSGPWTQARKQRILESRINAGKAVVEAVEQASQKPKVVLQSSAVDYYGARGNELITEENGPGDSYLSRVCIQWEASTEPVIIHGVRRVILRTGLVLSDEGGSLPLLALPFKLFVGGRLGSGRQWYPWIHMEDEIGAIRFLLENPEAEGPYNLTAPEPHTNQEFAETLGRVLKRPSFFPVPGFMMKAVLGDMSYVVLTGQRVVPKKLEQLGYDFRFPQLEAALSEIYRS